MEKTVFDYKIKLDELKCIYIKQTTKEEYLENTTTKKKLQDLYVLFKIRNDKKNANKIGIRLFGKNKLLKSA